MRVSAPSPAFLRSFLAFLLVLIALPALSQSASVQAFHLVNGKSGWLQAGNRLFWTDTLGSQWTEITPAVASAPGIGGTFFRPDGAGVALLTSADAATFTIALTPGNISMASGDHGSLNINVASATTFADVLNLGCAGLPTDATCTFSQPTITVANGVAQSLSVEVDTGNPLGSGATARNTRPNSISNGEACALPVGAILAILLFFNRRRLNKINPKLALFTLLLLLGSGATLLTGCGTSLNVNHTVAGSYTFQIIATGQKTGVTQTANVHLTVTQ